eukprot:g15702.t2
MSEDGPLYHEPRLRRRQSDAFVAFPQKALHVAFSGQLLHGLAPSSAHWLGTLRSRAHRTRWPPAQQQPRAFFVFPSEAGQRNSFTSHDLTFFSPQMCSSQSEQAWTQRLPVTSVTTEADGVWVACGESKSFRCLRCVFATPPKQLGNVKFAPALPSSRAALHTSVFIGCIIKAVFRYGRPFWRLNGFSGEVVAEATDDEPCFNCYDHCVGDCHMLVCFLNGSPARTWSLRTQADFVSGGIAFDHRLICHPGIGTIWRLCEFEVSPK